MLISELCAGAVAEILDLRSGVEILRLRSCLTVRSTSGESTICAYVDTWVCR